MQIISHQGKVTELNKRYGTWQGATSKMQHLLPTTQHFYCCTIMWESQPQCNKDATLLRKLQLSQRVLLLLREELFSSPLHKILFEAREGLDTLCLHERLHETAGVTNAAAIT